MPITHNDYYEIHESMTRLRNQLLESSVEAELPDCLLILSEQIHTASIDLYEHVNEKNN